MAWITSTIVKKHLQDSGVAVEDIADEQHVLEDTEPVQLRHAYLKSDSERVKTIDSSTPYNDGSNKLSGTSWKSLDHEYLVPGTVVVASDTLLSTVYVEGVDYVMDYAGGKIKRVAGGDIGDGDSVYIWYMYYTVHTKDSDYTINYESGTIERINEGNIANGSQVWVDYTVDVGTVADSLIGQAIVEAEGKILDRLSSEYDEQSTDQGLKTGATELTLSIVAREMAAQAMQKYPSSKAAAVSLQWRNLSIRYHTQAWQTLSKFLAEPGLRAARVQANQSMANG
jgi:hypothetical protein